MAGLGVRLPVAVLIIAVLLAGASHAAAAVSFPRSIAPGPCHLATTINTDTAPGMVVDPGGLDPNVPEVLVMSCTTVSVPSGTTRVTGSRALELRATDAVTIDGTLDASGFDAATTTPGAPGPGGLSGGLSVGFAGGDAASGVGGTAGGIGPNSGGSYASGSGPTAGDAGATNNGGGGGGAGRSAFANPSRGLSSTEAASMRGGSRGGKGGDSTNDTSLGGAGGGGGGAVRILAEGPISIPSGGQILAKGARGGIATGSSSPYGGGGGGGSGGLIDLIAPSVSVAGSLDARGGLGALNLATGGARGGDGGDGRIRILANDDPGGGVPARDYVGEHSVVIDGAVSGVGAGTITSSPAGISCPPDCTEPFDPDTSLNLTASPATSSTFSGWGADCAHAGASASCDLFLDDADTDNHYAANAAFGVVPGGGEQPPADPQPPAGKGRPDLLIERAGRKPAGEDLYGSTGAGQSAGAKLAPGDKASFTVALENDGDGVDEVLLAGPKGAGGFKLKYSLASQKVTKQITGGGLAVEGLAPGEARMLAIIAKAGRAVKPGSRKKFVVSGKSAGDPTLSDAVRIKLRVPKR